MVFWDLNRNSLLYLHLCLHSEILRIWYSTYGNTSLLISGAKACEKKLKDKTILSKMNYIFT